MTENNKNNFHLDWPTLIQVVFSALGVLLSFGLAALMFLAGVIGLLNPSEDVYAVPTAFSLAVGCLLVGGLLVVPVVFGLARLLGTPVQLTGWWPRFRKWFHPRRLLIAYPFILLLGYLSTQT